MPRFEQLSRVAVAPPRDTYRTTDTLVSFESDRAAGVWVHANPAQHVVVPFVGANRSHYLPTPHSPGTFEAPVDNDQAVWAPLVLDRGRRATTAELPDELTAGAHSVTARWNRLEVMRRTLEEPAPEPIAGSCTTTYSVDRRTVIVDHTLTFDRAPDAVALVIPETARAPLTVDLTADAAHTTTRIVVDGIAEWASPYSGLTTVHQIDVEPRTEIRLRAEVTPRLRVASTAHGHWYDRLLYAPITDRVLGMPSPLGALADPATDLDDVELLHLHWPEWFGFDDPAVHRDLIATLADRGIPVVWTAHNLTPHDRRPEVYDPIYQLWAETADAVIHHSEWGRDRMLARYRFRPDCRHEVIPHGHFGDLWPLATTLTRAEAETRLGLTPTGIRIGLVGAPRVDKRVLAFLDGVTQCSRTDIEVVCWSLRIDETAPVDDRIAVAEHYRGTNDATYATRLAACDVLAFPFDPDGDMLATGTIADAIGTGIPALVSDWPFLAEMLGDAGHPVRSHRAARSPRHSTASPSSGWPGPAPRYVRSRSLRLGPTRGPDCRPLRSGRARRAVDQRAASQPSKRRGVAAQHLRIVVGDELQERHPVADRSSLRVASTAPSTARHRSAPSANGRRSSMLAHSYTWRCESTRSSATTSAASDSGVDGPRQ